MLIFVQNSLFIFGFWRWLCTGVVQDFEQTSLKDEPSEYHTENLTKLDSGLLGARLFLMVWRNCGTPPLKVPNSNFWIHISSQPLLETLTLGESLTIQQSQKDKLSFKPTVLAPMICKNNQLIITSTNVKEKWRYSN